MSLRRFLNRPGPVRVVWRPLYEFGYACLRAAVAMFCAPFFRQRRMGRDPGYDRGGVIYCPNHESYLDPAFVQLAIKRRVTFVMTNDFYKLALGRWFFALVGAIPVNGGKLARTGIRRAGALVRAGHAIVIFPEGGLTRDGLRRRGQRGIAVLARRTGAPVVPVGIVGSRKAWGYGATAPNRSHVRVAFGKALRWDGARTPPPRAEERAFADAVMERIEQTIDRIHREYPHLWAPTPA